MALAGQAAHKARDTVTLEHEITEPTDADAKALSATALRPPFLRGGELNR